MWRANVVKQNNGQAYTSKVLLKHWTDKASKAGDIMLNKQKMHAHHMQVFTRVDLCWQHSDDLTQSSDN